MKILELLLETSDIDYERALESEDRNALRRLVDIAARNAGYIYRGWHGTPDGRFLGSEYIFKNRFGGKGVHWFSKDRVTASSYADDRRAWDYQNAEPKTLECYLKFNNPLVINGDGKGWRDAQRRGKTSDVIEQAQESGNDGVIINNVKDHYGDNSRSKSTITYAVFESSHIKTVELITKDNSGRVILLSKRFNDTISDIRF